MRTTRWLPSLIFLLLASATLAQGQPVTNVTVALLSEGDNNNISWGLPATIQLSVSTPGQTYADWFFQYGQSETGGPVFSSQVDPDATFYHPDSVTGFPIPSNCSCPCPYLHDSVSTDSSFVAVKTDTNGNCKVWISAMAMGQCVNPVVGLFKWYWQIRYFSGAPSEGIPTTCEVGFIPLTTDYYTLEHFTNFRVAGAPCQTPQLQLIPLRVPFPLANVSASDSIDAPIVPITDTNMLSAASPLGKGVVADGVTPVLFQATASAGTYFITITNDSEAYKWSLSDHLFVLVGQKWVQTDNFTINTSTNTATTFFYLQGVDWSDFLVGLSQNEISAGITVTSHSVPAQTNTVPFKIRPPPVALVHGYAADPSSWGHDFTNTLTSWVPTNFVVEVGYGTGSGNWINTSWHLSALAPLLDQILTEQVEAPLAKDWAFTRYDVVAHSQGGVLTRMLCQDGPFGEAAFGSSRIVSAGNFYRGRFRRVITIGSPHNGSRLLHYLLQMASSFQPLFHYIPRLLGDRTQPKFDPWGVEIPYVNDDSLYPVDSRIKFNCIQTTIASGRPPSVLEPIIVYAVLGLQFQGATLLPKGSDGVVDLDSQGGGPGTTSTNLNFADIAHSDVPPFFGVPAGQSDTRYSPVAQEVASLLNGSTNRFGSFVLPHQLSPAQEAAIDGIVPVMIVVPNLIIAGILAPGITPLDVSSNLDYSIHPPAGMPAKSSITWFAQVFGTNGVSQDGISLQVNTNDSSRVTVSVGDAVQGTVVLYASFTATNGTLVFAQPFVVVSRSVGAILSTVQIEPSSPSLSVGDTLLTDLWGVYSNGARCVLYVPSGQASFNSSDTNIAVVDSIGTITMKSAGQSTITATFQGLTAQATVSSLPAAPRSISGAVFVAELTNGTGPFSSYGNLLFFPATSGSNYQVAGINHVHDSTGTYSWSAAGAIGTVGAIDTRVGAFSGQFDFSTPASGNFAFTAGTNSQNGSFQMFSGQAPTAMGGASVYCVVTSGASPFASSGAFILTTSAGGDSYSIKGAGGGIGSSTGSCSYAPINTSGANLQLNDSINGLANLYLAFSNQITGAFALAQPSSGAFQMGSFVVLNTSVSITTPTPSLQYATGSSNIDLAGTAQDNLGITQVSWSNNQGGSGVATGTTNWSASGIALQLGANVLTITAADTVGNLAQAALTVTYTNSGSPPPSSLAPASIAGNVFSAAVTSGTGRFSTYGDLLFFPATSGSNYQVAGINHVHDSTGTYSWSAAGAIGTVDTIDTRVGAFSGQFDFGTADSGNFAFTAGTNSQHGSFQMFTGQAPTAMGGASVYCLVAAGAPPFASSGAFILTTSAAGDSYSITGAGGGIGSSTGSCSYGPINASGANLQLNDSINGLANLYLAFSNQITGAFALAQPSSGGFQMGSFVVLGGSVSITVPTSALQYTTGSSNIDLAGTAQDNLGVTTVSWNDDRGGSGMATGTTNWSASGITLQPGPNVLTVTATDTVGNLAQAALTVTYTNSASTNSPPPGEPVAYDAARDFTLTNGNPNGAWTYSWSTSLDSPQTLYTIQDTNQAGVTEAWVYSTDPIPIPLVGENASAVQQGIWPPNTLGFHPGWNSEFSHVVWTAPRGGRYSIEAGFIMLDVGDTDVYIVQRSVTQPVYLFMGNVTAPTTNASYLGTVSVNAGDQLDFAVGWGDSTPLNDTTALSVVIAQFVPTLQFVRTTFSNDLFQATLTGPPGSNYVIEASSDLLHWTPVSTNSMPIVGSLPVAEPVSANEIWRFFRAVLFR